MRYQQAHSNGIHTLTTEGCSKTSTKELYKLSNQSTPEQHPEQADPIQQ